MPENFNLSLIFYIFLLANVSYAAKLTISSITPLWSVGVEEQFYAIWPWIIKKSTNILKSLIVVLVLYFIIKALAWKVDANAKIYSFIAHARIDLMAMGGLGALIIFKDYYRIKKMIFSKITQLLSFGVIVFSVLYEPLHISSFVDNEINSIFYLIILLNVSSNPNTIIKLEGKVLQFFGKISYGLYVYHMVVILLFVKYFDKLELNRWSGLIPFLIIGITTLIATVSYYYFEKPILKLKYRFEVVKTAGKIN